MKKFIILLFLLLFLPACSKDNHPHQTSYSKYSPSSSISNRFTPRKDTPSQKNEMNNIVNAYKQYGLTISIHTFNDGYSVHLENQSLLQDIRDNDKNGFLKNTIIPITQKVSAQTHSKLYFNADDPNMELIVTANNGKIEYTINLSNN